MSRIITDHLIPHDDSPIFIQTTDDVGSGGAHHSYVVDGFNANSNPSALDTYPARSANILFQNGPIPENGYNGITNEVLLAIVKDRLTCFQAGPFACVENGEALAYVDSALDSLKQRTIDRQNRGVEGKEQA